MKNIDKQIFFSCSLILIIFGFSDYIFLCILGVLNVVTARRWIYLLRAKEGGLELCKFFSLCIMTGYITSTLSTQLNIIDHEYISLANYFNVGQYKISICISLISLSCIFLEYIGDIKPFYVTYKKDGFDYYNREIDIFIKTSMAMIFYAVLSGSLGYGGNVSIGDSSPEISIIGSTASTLLASTGSLSLLLALKNRDISKINKFLYYFFSISILFTILLTQGRRNIVIMTIIYIILLVYNTSFNKLSFRVVSTIAIAALFIIFGTKLYQAMRVNVYVDIGLWDRLTSGLSILMNPEDVGLNDIVKENLKERTFVLLYLINIIDLINLSNISWGLNLFHAFVASIPRVIIGTKNLLADETFLQVRLGLEEIDEPFTLNCAGLVDFGFIGLILFPGLYMLFLRYVYLKTSKYYNQYFRIIILCSIFYMLMNIESDTVNYILIFRNLAIIFCIYKFLSFVQKPFSFF